MNLSKRFTVILLCALLCAPASLARQIQDQQRDPQASNTLSQDVLIIIQQEKVRFTSQKAVAEMQLKVFDQTGEMVYDSGAIAETELNWPLQDANGQAVKSGMYAYQLSIKEAGAEKAQVRRGHFIVDRAQDRDGADKLWVTSQNSSGVGTELTVARDENATIAGASTNIERTVGRPTENSKRDAGEVESETQNQKEANKTSSAAFTAGTPGQIAKFTTATDVGDSAIAEVNGNIGIGTTETLAKLHVHGTTGIATSGLGAGFFFRNRDTGTTHTDYWGWYSQDNVARFWRQGVGDLMSFNPNGNVGIGTSSSPSRLTIEGQNALTIQGYEPFLNLSDSNSGLQAYHRIQSAHGDLAFFQAGTFRLLGGEIPFTARMVIKDGGNVGIGTISPNHQLSLGRGPGWTWANWGGSIELENATAIGWKTNTAGNRFGIGHTNGGLYFFRTASDPGTRAPTPSTT